MKSSGNKNRVFPAPKAPQVPRNIEPSPRDLVGEVAGKVSLLQKRFHTQKGFVDDYNRLSTIVQNEPNVSYRRRRLNTVDNTFLGYKPIESARVKSGRLVVDIDLTKKLEIKNGKAVVSGSIVVMPHNGKRFYIGVDQHFDNETFKPLEDYVKTASARTSNPAGGRSCPTGKRR